MKISREAQRNARKLFDASLVEGHIDTTKSLAIASVIIESKPRHFFQVLKEFTRLTRLELDRHKAIIESAIPLDPASETMITKVLKTRDAQADVVTLINPSLIGGTRIRLGSDVWDGSILTKLESLKAF